MCKWTCYTRITDHLVWSVNFTWRWSGRTHFVKFPSGHVHLGSTIPRAIIINNNFEKEFGNWRILFCQDKRQKVNHFRKFHKLEKLEKNALTCETCIYYLLDLSSVINVKIMSVTKTYYLHVLTIYKYSVIYYQMVSFMDISFCVLHCDKIYFHIASPCNIMCVYIISDMIMNMKCCEIKSS